MDREGLSRDTGSGATHFGFRTVRTSEKTSLVCGVFDRVASRYDLMNDLMSLGAHRLWKAAMLDTLEPRPDMRLLDMAGGTGDIACRFLERLSRAGQETAEKTSPGAIVCDVNATMIAVGHARALDRGIVSGLTWLCGDAEAVPLPERCVDAYTIAFGLRNVTRPEVALAEAYRVLRPGGRFLCLEFSHVVLPVFDRLYDLYSFNLIPALGMAVTGDAESYRYLVESIRRFPAQETLAGDMRNAGFERVTYRNLSGGIAALHSAWRV